MDERDTKPSFDEFVVKLNEIKTLTNKSLEASEEISRITNQIKNKSYGVADILDALSDVQQEIDKINANDGIRSTLNSMQDIGKEELEGLQEKVNEIKEIHATIQKISHITQLLSLNAAIEMSRYQKEEEERKAFEIARKSTIEFKTPILTEKFTSEMEQLTKEMKQIREKRLTGLKEAVLDFIRKTIQDCQLDFLETTGEMPTYGNFAFDFCEKNSKIDYYTDDEEGDIESEWFIQNFYIYNKEQKWQKSDFYVSYQDKFIRIENLITNYIQNHLLQKENTVLFTVEELKEAFGEDLFKLN